MRGWAVSDLLGQVFAPVGGAALAGVLFGLGSGMFRGPYAVRQLGQALGLSGI